VSDSAVNCARIARQSDAIVAIVSEQQNCGEIGPITMACDEAISAMHETTLSKPQRASCKQQRRAKVCNPALLWVQKLLQLPPVRNIPSVGAI
jgi:hypothetical protein